MIAVDRASDLIKILGSNPPTAIKTWPSLFTQLQFSHLYEYQAIDSGGYLYMNNLNVVI